ncbi:MAG: sigma-70 family RNA polymerase sigma factor [Myxococcota bacterium]|nr:sigma-70 family RNA polymerase sigma factor [Myxococcota bacterium]
MNLAQADRQQLFMSAAFPHRNELLGSAFRLTGNAGDAEDLVQETFLKALTFFDRFVEGTNCRAWLYRIMTNTFINQYRRRNKENEIFGTDNAAVVCAQSQGQSMFNDIVDPETVTSSAEACERIDEALLALPPVFREVVSLADIQGLAYKDIAEMVNCPVGTVMSRLFRGRRLMREQLDALAAERNIGTPEESICEQHRPQPPLSPKHRSALAA